MTNSYVPGVCNIGEAEIAQRKMIGWIALIVTVLYLLACYYFSLAPLWRFVAFLPASMSATGFLQGFMQFCAGFGMEGVFNFSSELRKTESVSQVEFRAADRKKALQIIAYSLLIGLVVAIAGYLA